MGSPGIHRKGGIQPHPVPGECTHPGSLGGTKKGIASASDAADTGFRTTRDVPRRTSDSTKCSSRSCPAKRRSPEEACRLLVRDDRAAIGLSAFRGQERAPFLNLEDVPEAFRPP